MNKSKEDEALIDVTKDTRKGGTWGRMKSNFGRPTIWHAVVAFYLYMVAYAVGFTLTPQVVLQLCDNSYSRAGVASGVLYLVNALATLCTAPLLGHLSDWIGRIPIMLLSLVGFAIDLGMFGIASYFSLSVWVLVITRIIGGMTNCFNAMAFAYIADISKPEDRSAKFGLVLAAYGLAAIGSPSLAGFLGDKFGYIIPLSGAVMAVLVCLIYCEVLLPESRVRNKHFVWSWQNANPFRSFGLLWKCPFALSMAVVYFLVQTAEDGVADVFILYIKDKYDMSSLTIGLVLGMLGFCFVIDQAVLLPLAIRFLKEKTTLLIVLVIDTVTVTAYPLIPSEALFYPLLVFRSIAFMAIPICQGLVSKQYAHEKQGELMGIVFALQQLSACGGPVIFNNLFSYYTSDGAWPSENTGFVFWLAAIFFGVNILLAAGTFYFFKETRGLEKGSVEEVDDVDVDNGDEEEQKKLLLN